VIHSSPCLRLSPLILVALSIAQAVLPAQTVSMRPGMNGPKPGAPEAVRPEDSKAVIFGKVTDFRGEGRPGVTVRLNGGARFYAAVTDQEGNFRFSNLPAGWYHLHESQGASISLDLQRNQEQQANLKLPPTASISGQLLDDLSEPVAGCGIRAVPNNHRMAYTPSLTLRTDEEGAFRFDDLVIGGYRLYSDCSAVRLPQRRPLSGDAMVNYGYGLVYKPSWFPGGDYQQASVIWLLPGEEIKNVRLRVDVVAGAMLRVETDNTAVSGCTTQVALDSSDPSQRNSLHQYSLQQGPPQSPGFFSNIYFPVGNYRLTGLAFKEGQPCGYLAQDLTISAGHINQVKATFQPAIKVKQSFVRWQDTGAAPPIPAQQQTKMTAHISIKPVEGSYGWQMIPLENDRGTKEINLFPGPYRISIDGRPVTSVNWGGTYTEGDIWQAVPSASGQMTLTARTYSKLLWVDMDVSDLPSELVASSPFLQLISLSKPMGKTPLAEPSERTVLFSASHRTPTGIELNGESWLLACVKAAYCLDSDFVQALGSTITAADAVDRNANNPLKLKPVTQQDYERWVSEKRRRQ
jgi:hypothetical protein